MKKFLLAALLVPFLAPLSACQEDDDPGSEGAEGGDGDGDCGQGGTDCSQDAGVCCNGNTCVNFGENVTCAANCSIGNDCADCCCQPLQDGGAVCVANSCGGTCGNACSGTGSLCSVNGDCCEFDSGGSNCVNYGADGAFCAASCDTGADCVSGCCAPLEGGGGACSPEEFCDPDGIGPESTPLSFQHEPGVKVTHEGNADPKAQLELTL